ncbi:MAG: small-conductance mechanosensitive ion channel [Gemmatimonadales bacterium]
MQDTSIAGPVRTTGEAIRASLEGTVNTVLSALPRLLGFVAVLVIGWVLSTLLARGVAALLHAIKFNDLARRSGFADFVRSMGVRQDASWFIAGIAKWCVRLITLVVAFDLLGLPAVSAVFQQLLLWLPNLVVALVVLVVGGLAAKALARLARGATAEAGFSNPDALATVTKVAIWAFTIVVAVNQVGVASELINTLLIGLVGAVALAAGLAFGLGGRDRAAEILDRLGRRTGPTGPRLERSSGPMNEPAHTGPQAVPDSLRAVPHAGRSVPFDEDWTPRSGHDRRRVPRSGLDRRVESTR